MKTSKPMTVLGIISLFLLAASATQGASIKDLIGQLPAKSFAQEKSVAADLVGLGRDGLLELCQQLVPPGTGDDTQVRFALNAVTMYVSQPGTEAQRQMYVATLLQALHAASDKEVQAFLIRQLQLAGRVEAVKPLSEFLTDQRLCEPAAEALVRIGGEEAGEAFAQALPRATGNATIAIVRSLGSLRFEPAAQALLPFAESKDRDLALAALWSMANIGHPSAQKALSLACSADSSYRRAKAYTYYLLYARRLTETPAQRSHGLKICHILVRAESSPANIRCSALGLLVDVLGDEALSDLLKVVDSDNAQLQAGALSFAQKIPGSQATEQWIKKSKQVPMGTRVQILSMLGRRGDLTALPTLIDALKDPDPGVRLVAIDATMDLAGEPAIGELLKAMQRADTPEEIKAFQAALSRLDGPKVLSAVASALDDMPTDARVALLGILENRQARAYSGQVIAQTQNENQTVRRAALQALAKVAQTSDLPMLIKMLLNAGQDGEVVAIRKAVIAAARQIDDDKAATAGLIAVLDQGDTDAQIRILRTLPGIGSPSALDSVIEATARTNTEVQDVAFRALTDWPTTAALPELFKLAQTSDQLTHQVLAIRGCIRLISAAHWPADNKVRMLQQTLDAAQRVEEKKAVLASAANLRTVDSLIFVSTCLYQEDLNHEAALALAKIACPQGRRDRGLTGGLVALVLRASLEKIEDEKIKQRVQDHLKNMSEPRAAEPVSPVQVPEGFVPLFNGKDLLGWKGLLLSPYDNPAKRATLPPEELKKRQAEADKDMRKHWFVDNGILCFDGNGHSLATSRQYGDFELLVDWKLLTPNGDSGIYLRGSPQVQIWDPAFWKIGSGGLYNNKENPSKPTEIADNPIGQWNTFRIQMKGERVTVHLNDRLIVDNVVLENYWDRSRPIFPLEQIELQCHGNPICFRNIFIKQTF